ncbi:hypothetical protein TNCV_1698841 [Trichonephila clavipes]|nr:hypothetical protein TNCV_1698841 [Trichonephila clavipes]
MALPFIRVLRNPMVKQDNTRSHATGILRPFLDTENVLQFRLPARSSTEIVRSMVAELLARHHTAVTTVVELCYRIEAAWSSVPAHVIQSLFDSIPSRISAIITARCSSFWY